MTREVWGIARQRSDGSRQQSTGVERSSKRTFWSISRGIRHSLEADDSECRLESQDRSSQILGWNQEKVLTNSSTTARWIKPVFHSGQEVPETHPQADFQRNPPRCWGRSSQMSRRRSWNQEPEITRSVSRITRQRSDGSSWYSIPSKGFPRRNSRPIFSGIGGGLEDNDRQCRAETARTAFANNSTKV